MQLFRDVEGARIITSHQPAGNMPGLTEALVLELAVIIDSRDFDDWNSELEQLGRLEGLHQVIQERGCRTLSVEESRAAVGGLHRMAFPDNFSKELPNDIKEIAPSTHRLCYELTMLGLDYKTTT